MASLRSQFYVIMTLAQDSVTQREAAPFKLSLISTLSTFFLVAGFYSFFLCIICLCSETFCLLSENQQRTCLRSPLEKLLKVLGQNTAGQEFGTETKSLRLPARVVPRNT